MLLSQLIEKLEEIKREHGDIPVFHFAGYDEDIEPLEEMPTVDNDRILIGH